VKHETFKDAAVGEAFQVIEGSLLPSLTLLLESAAGAQPGVDAEAHAQELRLLAGQLEELTRLFGGLGGSAPGDH
jgi:hypothetical protein